MSRRTRAENALKALYSRYAGEAALPEFNYSEKQLELIRTFERGELKRLNILHGSVRSGKTWVSLVLWGLWVRTMPKEKSYLMAAKTLTNLKRNCLDLCSDLFGANFTYSLSAKEGQLFGRKIYLEGVNDSRAETKIRGMTLQGAYCDELTLFTEDFFSMLLTRLSDKSAKLIATTNPDSPRHWLKKNYIDHAAKKNVLVKKFLIDDNPFLDPEYVQDQKRLHSGLFYDRFILGRWVLAAGRVYPMVADNPEAYILRGSTYGLDGQWYVSVDYGTANPCSMGLWCVRGKQAIRVREYYYSSRDNAHRQLTDEEYYLALEELTSGVYVRDVIVDPSAASFIETIRRHRNFHVRKADNDVLDGIRVTAALLSGGMVKVHESCRASIDEFSLYSWDEKKHSDTVIKEHDHAMDEIRYFCYTLLAREFRWTEWKR
ncbi:phage terminase large subunit [Clostridia bacterium]|nr:phage terminase large subunit [Clostridia bacterium]